MIKAWVLYYTVDDKYKFEERDGTDFNSTDPTSWGLTKHDEIALVLQSAQFLGAWLQGERVKP